MLTKEQVCYLLIAIVAWAIVLVGAPLLMMANQTEVGDIQTTQHTTEVYSSYQPGKLGERVCTLQEGTDVEIVEILTSNDLPNHVRMMLSEIMAFRIRTSQCSGWVLPKDID